MSPILEALYSDGRGIATMVLAVVIFACGIKLGISIRSSDSRALALQGAVLSELVANSKCVWYAPDSVRRRGR